MTANDSEISEMNEEIMVLSAIYPDCVVCDEDGMGAKVTVQSLTEGVANCELRFVLAEEYPVVIPPLKTLELSISGSSIYDEVRYVMEDMLKWKANNLVERGETAIVTSLLEDLSRMMIVATHSCLLENVHDACASFCYSMRFVDEEPELVNHPLIGSLFSMLPPEVILRIMRNMDAGTLLRFTGTCKTFMKLGYDHPELFRKFISKNYGKKFAMSVPLKNLRNETLAIVKQDPNDPLVRRIAMEKEAEEHAKEEAMKGKTKTKVGLRYVSHPNYTPRTAEERARNRYGYYYCWWLCNPVEKVVYIDGVATKVKLRGEIDPSRERTNFFYGDLGYLLYHPPY